MQMDKNLKIAIAASAVAVLAVGAYFLTRESKQEENDVEDEETVTAPSSAASASAGARAPAPSSTLNAQSSVPERSYTAAGTTVPKSKLLGLLRDMISNMEGITKEREQRKAQMMADGQDEEEADAAATAFVQSRMEELDGQLQAKHGISQSAMMEAQQAYAEDEDVAELVEALKVLIIGPEQAAQMEEMARAAPAHMTAESFLPVFQRHLDAVEGKVAELFRKAARDTAGRDKEEKEQYLQFLLYRNLDSIQAGAIEGCGLDLAAFQGCMVKFGQDPRLTRLVMTSQERQDKLREQLLSA